MTTFTYISGPMTGIEHFNFPAFDAARNRLLARGESVYSPADYDRSRGFDPDRPLAEQDFDLTATLLHDLEQVAICDKIYMLKGWGSSRGACAEFALALALGKTIIHEAEGLPVQVIALGGGLRAGKDTVADYLVAKHGFTKIGMSDPLNEAMMTLDPIVDTGAKPKTYSQLIAEVGYTEAKKNPEVRRLLQRFGKEVGRDLIDEDVWVNMAIRRIDDLLDEGKRVVLTGVRFENELEIAHYTEAEGKAVTAYVERRTDATAAQGAHASENGVRPEQFDCLINNDGTIDELYRAVETAFNL